MATVGPRGSYNFDQEVSVTRQLDPVERSGMLEMVSTVSCCRSGTSRPAAWTTERASREVVLSVRGMLVPISAHRYHGPDRGRVSPPGYGGCVQLVSGKRRDQQLSTKLYLS